MNRKIMILILLIAGATFGYLKFKNPPQSKKIRVSNYILNPHPENEADSVIRKGFVDNEDKVNQCYLDAKTADPSLAGVEIDIEIELLVTQEGKVSKFSIASPRAEYKKIEDCIQGVFTQYTYRAVQIGMPKFFTETLYFGP
jgi:hypothetical protein